MGVKDLAMVAADTSRSRAYAQALAQHGLLPGLALLLPPAPGAAPTGAPPPGGRDAPARVFSHLGLDLDLDQPLEHTLEQGGAVRRLLPRPDLNHPDNRLVLAAQAQEVFIYSGVGGCILGRELLGLGKRFLHVHGGWLPDYKGSTTNYYSLLAEGICGASAIFLAPQIDSGPVLLRRRFQPPPRRDQLDHVHDSLFRAAVLVETLRHFQAFGQWPQAGVDNRGGRTYYIMHPLLRHLAILAGGQGQGGEDDSQASTAQATPED